MRTSKRIIFKNMFGLFNFMIAAFRNCSPPRQPAFINSQPEVRVFLVPKYNSEAAVFMKLCFTAPMAIGVYNCIPKQSLGMRIKISYVVAIFRLRFFNA